MHNQEELSLKNHFNLDQYENLINKNNLDYTNFYDLVYYLFLKFE